MANCCGQVRYQSSALITTISMFHVCNRESLFFFFQQFRQTRIEFNFPVYLIKFSNNNDSRSSKNEHCIRILPVNSDVQVSIVSVSTVEFNLAFGFISDYF